MLYGKLSIYYNLELLHFRIFHACQFFHMANSYLEFWPYEF
jgi:hypothetical protein